MAITFKMFETKHEKEYDVSMQLIILYNWKHKYIKTKAFFYNMNTII